MNETFKKIRQIVANQLGVDESEITMDSHLQDDLNSDPLSLADLLVSLEDEFKIKVSQEDQIKFNTVGDIFNYVSDQIGEV